MASFRTSSNGHVNMRYFLTFLAGPFSCFVLWLCAPMLFACNYVSEAIGCVLAGAACISINPWLFFEIYYRENSKSHAWCHNKTLCDNKDYLFKTLDPEAVQCRKCLKHPQYSLWCLERLL